MEEEKLLSQETLIWLIVIVIAIVAAIFFISYWKKRDELIKHKRKIDNFPTIISTLGVLGTFYGITTGLMHFDTGNLKDSIPELLKGLKTAFWTSLAGMSGSMILSFVINKLYDDNDKGASDINNAAALITKTIQNNAANQTAFYNTVGNILQSLDTVIKKLDNSVSVIENHSRNVSTSLNSISNDVQTITSSSNSSLSKLNDIFAETAKIAPTLVDNQNATNVKLDTIKEGVTELSKTSVQKQSEILSAVSSIAPTIVEKLSENSNTSNVRLDEINKSVLGVAGFANSSLSKQNDILAYVAAIPSELKRDITSVENKMTETNGLLAYKFDEFSELLKKSNTETLVEVMKRVTEEFEKQMGELIGRLVKENFDQLNTSVERLNTWQQENKDMISALTAQYKQMADNFSATDTTLQHVGNETAYLVSEEGKLQKIVVALNEVMVNDKKFVQITQNLTSAADLTKENTQQFKAFTNDLTVWLNKQKDFKTEIEKLIKKLEEINRINNYSDEFWKNTKKGFDDGIKIISDNNTKLFEQIKENNTLQLKQISDSSKQFQDEVTKITKQVQKQNDDTAKTYHSMLADTKEHLGKLIAEIQNGMGKSVTSIAKGSEELNKQITALDQHFYNRLGTTLGQLDECISKMLSHYNNRR